MIADNVYWNQDKSKWSMGFSGASYADLVFLDTNYWLSSRHCYVVDGSDQRFGMEFISPKGYDYHAWIKRDGVSLGAQTCAVRPIVAFPRDVYELDTSTTPAKIVKK